MSNIDIVDSRDLEEKVMNILELRTAVEDAEKTVEEAREAMLWAFGELKEYQNEEEPDESDLEDLEKEAEDAKETFEEAKDFLSEKKEELEEAEAEDLELLELREQVDGWSDGVSFINEDDFEKYVRDHMDLGLPELPHWLEVDWESTAANLRHDYSSASFHGNDYLYLSL